MLEEQTGAFEVDRDGVIARFYGRAVQDLEETEKQGRAIFTEVPFVTIRIPGDNLSVVDEMVRDHHKARWPKGWAAFCAKQEGLAGGTPIMRQIPQPRGDLGTRRRHHLCNSRATRADIQQSSAVM